MGRKASKPPVVANPDAREKLEAAAAAAGLSIQELADLVFEAGVVPPKGGDGMVERYTIEDLGNRLWSVLQGVAKNERSLWFEGLAPTQRMALIVVLRDQGYRTEVIARDLGLEQTEVLRTWNAYSAKIGAQIVGIRLDSIAGQLQMASERAQEMAIDDGDHKGYWSIERDKVKLLQSIGIVDKAAHRVEHVHKIDDVQKAELQKMVELEAKKNRRGLEIEELKAIESKGEPLPEEVKDDYDSEDE